MPITSDHGDGFSPAASQKTSPIEPSGNSLGTEGTSDLFFHSETDVRSKYSPTSVGRVGEMLEMEDLTKVSGYSPRAASLDDVDDEGSEKESFVLDRRDSNSVDPSFALYTPDEERLVIKTFDRRIVLFIALLYMLSYLDRSSKQNALVELILF